MKLSWTVPLLAAVAAYADSSSVVKSRQASIQRRATDVCGEIDGELPGFHGIHISGCVCMSTVSNFIQSNGDLRDASRRYGVNKVTSALIQMINNCHGKKTCNYPPHSTPVCSHGNPCDFTCKDGYEPWPRQYPTQCVCKPPYKQCNGKCGNYPHGCPSSGPRAVKRSVPICEPGHKLCGIPGGNHGKGWECIDTKHDLESCGGCLVTSPFGDTDANGVDCSQIENAYAVACQNGACKVSECIGGFIPSLTDDSCIPLFKSGRKDTHPPFVAQ